MKNKNMNMNMNQFWQLIAYTFWMLGVLFIPTGCSSGDEGPKDPVEKPYTLVQGKDFTMRSADMGQYAQFVLLKPNARIELNMGAIAVNKVEVRPANLGITTQFKGNKVILENVSPCKATVIVNDNVKNPVYLFANEQAPKEWQSLVGNVIRFQKGVHKIGKYEITEDNVTVFLEDEAFIEGYFYANGKKNIRILGYGIIDGRNAQKAIQVERCSNISVQGPILMSRTGWTSSFFECDGVNMKNIKVLSSDMYSDGVDIVGTSNVVLDDLYIHNDDDCLAFKTNKYGFAGNVENITVKNSVFWSGTKGNALEIGWELDGEYVRNIHYENIDIIRKEPVLNKNMKHAAISIHHCGNSHISDISYKNIRVEDVYESLIWIELIPARDWGSGGGHIKNVTFEDIQYTKGPEAFIVIKNSSTGTMTGIEFSGLRILDNPVTSLKDPIFKVEGIDVKVK
ncbi:MAG: glycosyl hydrolase family 28 protein [Bacteroidales bacterium]